MRVNELTIVIITINAFQSSSSSAFWYCSPMRVDRNVEAADKLTVVQAIVPAAVRLGNAARWTLNIMMVLMMIVAMLVIMLVIMIVMMMLMMAISKAHLMTTSPWSLVRTCFSGAKATVYLDINMIIDSWPPFTWPSLSSLLSLASWKFINMITETSLTPPSTHFHRWYCFYDSPALGLAVVVPLNLRLLDFKHWRSVLMRIVIMTKAMVSKVMIMNVLKVDLGH